MRDDVQDAISSVDPAFLQQTTTRVHVTYNVVAPEPDHTIMFLTTSTESWDCHVARETSLFDDDDASSVDSSCWQDEGGIYYDATVEDDESSYDGSGGSSSTASSSMLGSGGTEYSKPDPPFDPIGTIQSVFVSSFIHPLQQKHSLYIHVSSDCCILTHRFTFLSLSFSWSGQIVLQD
jgi:hypothetical protein